MYIVLGATGNIGSALTKLLVNKGKKVIAISHNKEHIDKIERMEAQPAVVNVLDTEKLTALFKTGKRLFFLNPPGDITQNASEQEHKTVASIVQAIKNSDLEKIVAESTYGAQPGKNLGDLDVLYNMEQSLARLDNMVVIIRGAYYMSNWDMAMETAKTEGRIYSLFPPDFSLPMVAPADIAQLAATLLIQDDKGSNPNYITGPQDYSPHDVAAAFADALRTPVQAVQVKPDEWLSFLMKLGFSKESANSMANMTKVTLAQDFERPESPSFGKTTLHQYITALVEDRRNRTRP
jgi:uncharacterized protein YbjT (DUF2867 family)